MSTATARPTASRRVAARRPAFLQTKRGMIGATILLIVVAVAVLGPLVAPHALDAPIGLPGDPPSGAALLGTDALGRDVLSRVLHGGLQVLWLAGLATLLTYAVGVTVGMAAGLLRSWIDPALMRVVDVLMGVPPLLLLLVLVTGAGTTAAVMTVGIALVLVPGVSRLVRTATLEIATTSYIEAAIARGERTTSIMRREILPNILPPIVADAGVRFLTAIFLVASLNFLGVGAQPPSADWGLMVAENRDVLATNIWAVAAPAIMLALLTVSVNLLGDAYTSTLDRSTRTR